MGRALPPLPSRAKPCTPPEPWFPHFWNGGGDSYFCGCRVCLLKCCLHRQRVALTHMHTEGSWKL